MAQGTPIKRDLVGQRFGMLKVLSVYGKRGARWTCICDCGKNRIYYTSDLVNRHNISCGCNAGKQTFRHSFASDNKRHRLYRIWDGMRKRCSKHDDPAYARYGGRGIAVEWPDFLSFKNDMLDSYLKHAQQHGEVHTTIDRIDNDGNYSMKNFRWATQKVQGNNRPSANVYVTYRNKLYTVTQYAEKTGQDRMKIYAQLRKLRLREMAEEGIIEVKYVDNHAFYMMKS